MYSRRKTPLPARMSVPSVEPANVSLATWLRNTYRPCRQGAIAFETYAAKAQPW
jgi:hypothetical protein